MIRPRGGDFLYSDQEVQVMRKDIELMKRHGADGLVLGALTEDGRVDAELCMELLGNVLSVQCEKRIINRTERHSEKHSLMSHLFLYTCMSVSITGSRVLPDI